MPPDQGLTGTRLVPEARCDHGSSHRGEPQGASQPQVVRATAAWFATWADPPVRWPDLETASLLLALVARWLPVPVVVVDVTASAVFCNRAWSSFSGLTRAASLGRGWLSALEASAHQPATERVAAAEVRACEIVVADSPETGPRRTRLLMEPLLAFDGSALGKVLWVPQLGSPVEAATEERHLTGVDRWDDGTSVAFVARVQHALDAHQHATTTIAALVIEVEPAPAGSGVEPAWDAEIDQALVRRIEQLLGDLQTVVSIGLHKLAVLCEQVTSYREVIQLAELVVELSDDPPLVGGVVHALSVSVGIAFPHLPGDQGEAVLANAVGAADLARSQGVSGYEVVIGTGPGSSDVTRPAAVQEHLSAPSARLQPQTPS